MISIFCYVLSDTLKRFHGFDLFIKEGFASII